IVVNSNCGRGRPAARLVGAGAVQVADVHRRLRECDALGLVAHRTAVIRDSQYDGVGAERSIRVACDRSGSACAIAEEPRVTHNRPTTGIERVGRVEAADESTTGRREGGHGWDVDVD